MIPFELFAQTSIPPDRLWRVVGDPWRLPEWTDAQEVVVLEEPIAEGGIVRVRVGEVWQEWALLTVGTRIWEARTQTRGGTLGIGARVAPDPRGSRLVLAGALEPARGTVRARVLTVPRLRSRFDHWTRAVLAIASQAP